VKKARIVTIKVRRIGIVSGIGPMKKRDVSAAYRPRIGPRIGGVSIE
jgi:hypothetical protein